MLIIHYIYKSSLTRYFQVYGPMYILIKCIKRYLISIYHTKRRMGLVYAEKLRVCLSTQRNRHQEA